MKWMYMTDKDCIGQITQRLLKDQKYRSWNLNTAHRSKDCRYFGVKTVRCIQRLGGSEELRLSWGKEGGIVGRYYKH